MITRADIVRVARSYIGTPWHHAGRLPGVGLDCAGVVICAMRETGIAAPDFDIPAYDPVPDGRTMLEWCDRYMDRIDHPARCGNVVVLITDLLPQHLALLGDHAYGGLSIIHAASNARPPRVVETRLLYSRAQRFVAAYALRGVE